MNVINEAKVKLQHVSPSISVSQAWSLLFRNIKILVTMYDKNEFLQLLEYFLPNIIMKQQQIRTANKIVTSLFLRWPLKMKKTRDVSVADITVVDITAEDFA